MNSPSNPSRTSPRHWLSLLALLLALNWAASVCAQSYTLTNLWSVAPLTNTIINNTASQYARGCAYNPVTGHLLVVSREPIPDFGTNVFGTNGIYVVNAATGVVQGKLAYDTNLITGGNFAVNMVAVTDDGVIYVGNLTTGGANGLFRLYRWANESAQPTLAYAGDPSSLFLYGSSPQRYGDSMALRGTGANTQILLGTFNQTLALLTTTDGVTFTSKFITSTMANSDSRWGLAWGPGNTCYLKQSSGHVRLLNLDPANSIATVITNLALTATAGAGGPLDVDLSRNLLALIDTTNHKLLLYDISDPSNPIQQDAIKSFPAANGNGNFVGSVALRNGKLFALESNNGLLAYTLGQTNLPATIVTAPATIALWQGAPSYTLTATYGGTRPFTYQWQCAGTNLPGATQASLTLNNISFNHAGAYRVAVSNALGGAVSASATLTITPNAASGVVTKLWDLPAGTRPYLTYRPAGDSLIGYKEYGVAINPVNTNIIVVTRQNPTNMIAVLDKQGNFLHYIDYSGLSVPVSGLPMNKVDVADDGVVYVGNFYNSSSVDITFNIYAFDEGGNNYGKWIAYKGDPANGASTGTTGRSTNSWGYTFSARGSGTNTQILIGSSASNLRNFAILRDDGSGMGSFKSTLISVTDSLNLVPLGFCRLGMDWGPSENTVWAKTSSGNLILLSYDLGDGTNGTAGALTYIPQTVSLPNIMRTVPPSATQVKYDPLTGLLGCLRNGSPPNPVSVGLYDVSDILGAGPFQVDQEFFSTYNSDIEFLGSMDFAKGYLVTLGLNNGLMMFQVNSGTASLPVILSQPASVSTFVGLSPALKVVADDTTGLMSYQWYLNGQSIPGATDATYTLNNVQTNQAGWYTVRVINAGGYRESAPALLTVTTPYNTAQMIKAWSLSPGDTNNRSYLTTSYYEYGLAFNPATSNLLVVSYDSVALTPYVAVLDALTGAHKTNLNVNGVNVGSGKGLLHKIGVADDGVIYGCKQGTPSVSVPAVVYRWANDSGDPAVTNSVAFSGDPLSKNDPSDYSGLTFGVRGAGTNTQIIMGSYSNAVAILTTTDGTNFVSNEIKVNGAPYKFCRLGLCWGAGNTFWTKSYWGDPGGSQLDLVQYDLAAGTGTILKTYSSGLPSSSSITTIAYDDTLKLLGGIGTDSASDSVQVFDLSNLTAGPQLRDQELFPTANPSIEQNGALTFGLAHSYLFALAENNGVMAFRVNANYGHFKVLSVTPAPGAVALTWEAVSSATYQVQRATSLTGAWTDLGSAVTASGDTASYTDTTPDPKMCFYRVVLK
jgi:hypothetical protein